MSDLKAFRDEVKDWLEQNCPPTMRTPLLQMKKFGVEEMLNTKILSQNYGLREWAKKADCTSHSKRIWRWRIRS